MCRTIHQKVRFPATPDQVYRLLADEKQHSVVAGRKVQMSRKAGGAFAIGMGEGIVVDLEVGRRLVLAWRGAGFPRGVFSMASFFLAPTPSGGTELRLVHRGVPKELIPQMERAWRENYWAKMKSFLAERA